MAKNENLTPQELDFLRIQGKNTQQNNAQTAGNTGADGKSVLITPYIERPRWKNPLGGTTFDLSTTLSTGSSSQLDVSQSQIRAESDVFTLMPNVSSGIRISTLNNFSISGVVTFPSNSTGYRQIILLSKTIDNVLGSTIGLITVSAVNGADTILPFSYFYDRIRVDRYNNFRMEYIQIVGFQNSGGSLDVVGQIGITEA